MQVQPGHVSLPTGISCGAEARVWLKESKERESWELYHGLSGMESSPGKERDPEEETCSQFR